MTYPEAHAAAKSAIALAPTSRDFALKWSRLHIAITGLPFALFEAIYEAAESGESMADFALVTMCEDRAA